MKQRESLPHKCHNTLAELAADIQIKNNQTSGKVPFRINEKTIIYVAPGSDPEAIRAKYANRQIAR